MYLNPLSIYIYKVCIRKMCLQSSEDAYVYSARHVLITMILVSVPGDLPQWQPRSPVAISRINLYLDQPVDEQSARSYGH